MNLTTQIATENQPIGASTAFRLPKSLLQAVDQWCEAHDITRSQFFRHCITDRVKSLEPNQVTHAPKEEQQQQWSPELYDRLRRRR
jgi:hypothetical protein